MSLIKKITVTNRVAHYSPRGGKIICNNADYKIKFIFDSEWESHPEKTARFIWGGGYVDKIFTGDECEVPPITGASVLYVGVYAGDLKTTTDAVIPCTLSIKCKTSMARPEKVEDYRDRAEIAAERAEAAAARAAVEHKPLDFLSNTKLDYGYDEASGAKYFVLRVFRDKLDGSKQFPLVYAPNGMNSGKYSTYDLMQKEDFLLAINAGVFDTSTTIPKGLLIQDGTLLQDSAVNNDVNKCKALTIDGDGNLGSVEWNANGADLVANGIVSAVCGFMPIIVDYQPVDSSEWNSISHYTENAQRQIIGQFDNGDYAIVTCEGRGRSNSDGWTIAEAQNVCRKLGLKFAYNLDGGGSTETVLCKKHLNAIYEAPTGRKVPTFIVFNGTTQLDIEEIVTYTDLEFLQVTGTQYIDTGIPETVICSSEYRVQNENWTNSSGHILSSLNSYTAFIKGSAGSETMLVKRGSYTFSGYNGFEFNITPSEPYTIKETYDGAKITAYCGDKVFHSFTPDKSTLSVNNNFYMFAYPAASGTPNTKYMFTGKFYYLKLWDAAGNLIHHYKPVQRGDGVRGLYDVVTQKFLVSVGGTQF